MHQLDSIALTECLVADFSVLEASLCEVASASIQGRGGCNDVYDSRVTRETRQDNQLGRVHIKVLLSERVSL